MATVTNLRATLKEIGATDRSRRRRGDGVSRKPRQHATISSRSSFRRWSSISSRRRSLRAHARRGRTSSGASSSCRRAIPAAIIEPLKDDYTLIMTASAADRTSFGCGIESNATYFADALFQHALRFEDSFVKAFAQARERIAAREKERESESALGPADLRRRRDGRQAAQARGGAAGAPPRRDDLISEPDRRASRSPLRRRLLIE